MTIALRGTATSATNANVVASGSLACTKPTGVVSGDVMVAQVTGNDTVMTGPSGWTKLLDQVAGVAGTDHFETSWWWKLAGGAEGASYSWTKAAGSTAAPLVITIAAWSGVDNTTPIGGSAIIGFNTDQTEPLLTPTPTAYSGFNLAVYGRSVRFATGTNVVPTFTSGATTELADTGIWSGGTISYAHACYVNAEAVATPPCLGITTSQTESHTVTACITLRDATQPKLGTYINNPDTFGTAQANRRASRW